MQTNSAKNGEKTGARWARNGRLIRVPVYDACATGMVVKISPSGEVLSSLMDRHGETVFTVSAVTEFGGKLWLGNLAGDFVSVVDLEKVGE